MIQSSSEGLTLLWSLSYPIIPSGIHPVLEMGPHDDRENSKEGGIGTHNLRTRSPMLHRLSHKAKTAAGRGYVRS